MTTSKLPSILALTLETGHRLPHARWHPAEIAFWLLLLAVFFVFPDSLVFGSQILIVGLFAVSLDLILGYAGIVSLGHAAFFGMGAYTAGLLAVHGWGEPITGLLAAGVSSAVLGFAVSFLVVRGADLTRLMVTLGVGLMLYEAANKAAIITGGVDGLSGMTMWKLLGVFEFDIAGETAYFYSLVVLFLVFCLLRRLVNSPFGLSLAGIREGGKRMPAIGAPVRRHLIVVFTIGAAIAGIAGALPRPNHPVRRAQFARLFALRGADDHAGAWGHRQALWWAGRCRGVHAGAELPVGYQSGVLAVLDRFGAGGGRDVRSWGHHGRVGKSLPALRQEGEMTAALRTEGISKHWGAFKANSDVSISLPAGARHALIGPNGAGKTTFINLLTGVYSPTAGQVFLGEENVTHLPQHVRVKRKSIRTFQINTLFPGLTVLESVILAVCERKGVASDSLHTVAKSARGNRGSHGDPRAAAVGGRCRHGNKKPPVRKAAACGDRTGAGNQAEDPVDGQNRPRGFRRGKQGTVQRPGEASA